MNNFHYYQENQDELHSNPKSISCVILDKKFIFHTDDGVFSKNYVDYGSLALIKNFVPSEDSLPILDMGAGYGVIGIVLSKTYNREVLMCEINQRACGLIAKNIEENKANLASFRNSNLYEKIADDEFFSSIVTNPPIRAGKDTVYKIYDEAYNHLIAKGKLWVVIQKKQGAPSSKEHLQNLFGNCEIVKRDKGYYILCSTKENC